MTEPKDVYLEFEVRSKLTRYQDRTIRVYLGEGELGMDQDQVDEIFKMDDSEIEDFLNDKLYGKDLDWPVGYNVDPLHATVCDHEPDDWDTEEDEVIEVLLQEVQRIDEEEWDEEDD